MIQLFEYDYFEIRKFVKENSLKFDDKYKILVPSQEPADTGYVGFVNNLEIGVATMKGQAIKPIGKDFGFSRV